MTTLFISDLHLEAERPDIAKQLLSFLETEASEADDLYILGDLFEAWVGDDDPNTHYFTIKRALRKLVDGGIPVYFMHGNRDFMIGKHFARETGCTLLPDHFVAQLEGHKVLLLHGDTLCIDDEQYQKFRRKTRRPFFLWCLNRLPLSTRQKIADNGRAKSQAVNANKSENIMDVNTPEVERLMEQYQVNTMIHGHTHRPNRHQHKNGERLVLGDWHQNGWYIRVTEKATPELISFPISD